MVDRCHFLAMPHHDCRPAPLHSTLRRTNAPRDSHRTLSPTPRSSKPPPTDLHGCRLRRLARRMYPLLAPSLASIHGQPYPAPTGTARSAAPKASDAVRPAGDRRGRSCTPSVIGWSAPSLHRASCAPGLQATNASHTRNWGSNAPSTAPDRPASQSDTTSDRTLGCSASLTTCCKDTLAVRNGGGSRLWPARAIL